MQQDWLLSLQFKCEFLGPDKGATPTCFLNMPYIHTYLMPLLKIIPLPKEDPACSSKTLLTFFFPLLPTGTKLKHCSYSILLIPQL